MTREAFRCQHCGYLANADAVVDGGHVIRPRVPSFSDLGTARVTRPTFCGPMVPFQTSASEATLAHERYGPDCAGAEGWGCQRCFAKALVPLADVVAAQAAGVLAAIQALTNGTNTLTVRPNPRRPERWRKRKGDRFNRWTR